MAKKTNNTLEPIEKQLWKAADKLRNNIDAGEYKHVVLGLIFLKYISDSFEQLHDRLKAGEGDIRKALVEGRMVDCIVNLPAKLFLNTQIPASLWFLSRNKASASSASGNRKFRNRENEILFIDARNMGFLINRRTRELSQEDISKITESYHQWRNPEGRYEDVKGFCISASIDRVKELDFVLTPGRYVGLPEEEDDFNFNERFSALKAELEEQLKEEARLNEIIFANFSKI